MPKFLQRRWHGYHTVWAFLLMLVLIIIVSIYNWVLGVASLFLAGTLCFSMLQAELSFRRNLVEYINGLSFRIKRVEVRRSACFRSVSSCTVKTVLWNGITAMPVTSSAAKRW